MRVLLKTLGCRLNEAELETWSRDFQLRGYQLTDRPDDADLVVVNTCAVTQEAVRKSRKLMRRAQRENPNAKLVVSGCYVTLDPHDSRGMDGVDLVVDNRDKDRLVQIATEELGLHIMPDLATEPGAHHLLAHSRQRAFVKVQDGCRYRCTFCIVTLARGEERSRCVTDIINEINRLHEQGRQEAVLTGVHIGGYGSDNGSSLSDLVQRVLTETDIPRLRLGSVEPWDLQSDFWTLFESPRFMPHLHLPLQSGSDSVLRRMARRCKSDEFARLVEQARSRVADFNVTTDIMVGFPGETQAEWQQTLDLVEQIGFGHLHIFTFSPRRGTKAAVLPHPVSSAEKRRRSQELHQLDRAMKQSLHQQFFGRTLPILVEGPAPVEEYGENGWIGYTPNYLKVLVRQTGEQALANRIIDVRLETAGESSAYLTGQPLQAD